MFQRCRSRLKRTGILALTSAIFASVLAQSSRAQNSPSGTWELTLTQAKRGTAIIVFNPDFTLEGFEITSKKRTRSGSTDLRDGRPESDRNEDDSSGSGNSTSTTQTVGGAEIDGLWTYDERGRLIGYFESIFGLVEGDDVSFVTNAVSFRGVVNPGRRINLFASTEEGRVVYRGRPSNPRDISGDYFSVETTREGSELIQFVRLSPGLLPGEFDIIGTGPGFELFGNAILTSRGQMSLVTINTEGSITAATGRYNSRRGNALLRGTNGKDESVSLNLTPTIFPVDE